MFLSTRIFLEKNTRDELASNADILWARHAVFLPHERLLKPRKHSLSFVFSRPDYGCGFCPKDRQEIGRRRRENYARANRRRIFTRASAGQKMQTVLGRQKGAGVIVPGFSCVVHNKFWPLWWRISFSIRVQTTLSHSRIFFHNTKDKERNLCQNLLTIENTGSDLNARPAALCKWATSSLQKLSFQTLLQTRSTCRDKTKKKDVWEKSNGACLLSIRVQTTINHISNCFLPQYQRQRKCLF